MTSSDEQRLLDPERVAKRGFSTSFRGFDQDEVRRFLEELASALRRAKEHEIEAAVRPELDRITAERDQLQGTVSQLETELTDFIDRVRRAEERADEAASAAAAAAATPVVPAEVDEATLTLFLGQETVRVLETARTAARDITARAEVDATARLTAAEEHQAAVEAELTEKQREVDEAVAALRKAAEEEVARLRAEVEEATTAMRKVAETDALTVRESAEADAAVMRTDAEKLATDLRSGAEADSARVRREAETDALRVRNESAADALAAQDSAREQARLMLTEAQAVREKVLADLVKRRRAGRQHLDQVKAARDRLARSLAVVRKDLDEAMSELVAAVPDARAAMEAVGRRVPESADARKAAELAAELDSARTAGAALVEDADALPDIDDLFDRLRLADVDLPERGSATNDDFAGIGDEMSPDETATVESAGPETVERGDRESAAGEGEPTEPDRVESGIPADESEQVTQTGQKGRAGPGKGQRGRTAGPEKAGQPSGAARTRPSTREATRRSRATLEPDPDDPGLGPPGDDIDGVALEDGHPTGRRADADAEVVSDVAVDDADDENPVDLPEAFVERDVAMTRLGPDLRRQLKRALADDQSVVLDGLRRVRKAASAADLPAMEDVLAAYVAAFEGPLRSAADSGAEVTGGRRQDKVIDQLIERVARALVEPLRDRVERSIEQAGGDKSEVLEPIRAHYRDARAAELPGIADDALAEAFALGVYHALPDGALLSWVPDPRSEPGPDCFDNTLAGPVKKPSAFPTGHNMPLGGQGCRCLVLRVEKGR